MTLEGVCDILCARFSGWECHNVVIMKEKVKKEALIIILVFSALLILFLVTGISQKGGSYAVVTVNGEFFGNYPLSKDADIPDRKSVV